MNVYLSVCLCLLINLSSYQLANVVKHLVAQFSIFITLLLQCVCKDYNQPYMEEHVTVYLFVCLLCKAQTSCWSHSVASVAVSNVLLGCTD